MILEKQLDIALSLSLKWLMPNFGYIKTKESIMDKFIGDHKSSLSFAGAILFAIIAMTLPSNGMSVATWLMSPLGTYISPNQDAIFMCWVMTTLCLAMWIETGAKYWLFQKPSGRHGLLSNQWLCLGAIVAVSTVIHMVANIQSLNAPVQTDSFFRIGLMISGVLMAIGWSVQLFGYEQGSGNSQTPHSSAMTMWSGNAKMKNPSSGWDFHLLFYHR
jgi:hypothetical protein